MAIGGDNLALGTAAHSQAALGDGASVAINHTSEAHLLLLRDLVVKIERLADAQQHAAQDQQAIRATQEAMAENIVNFRQESLRAWGILNERQTSGERRISAIEQRMTQHETRLDGFQTGLDRVDGRAERWLRYIILAALISSPVGMIAVAIVESLFR